MKVTRDLDMPGETTLRLSLMSVLLGSVFGPICVIHLIAVMAG